MQNNPIPPTPAPTGDRSFLGHPRGLGYLGFTEAWERFSYYGMQTLLVLYMTRQLLLPGHVERIAGFKWFRGLLEWHGPLSTVALASAIFGLYTGLVYVTPIAGGIIADRWLGRTRTVTIGALLMAAGHFLMAFDVTFLLALLCLLTGVGCFKGNLAIQVGDLYAPNDLRRADAFQIYYLFINVAVIVAPLVTGTLGEKAGWHYGFGAAGVGMVLGLVIYLYGGRWLPPDSPAARAAHRRAATGSTDTDVGEGAKLTADDWKAMILLVALLPVLAVGAVVNQEIFDAYLLWVPDHVSLRFFGWTMPTTWLVSLDAVVSVSFLVLAVVFWRLWTKFAREPEEITKITLGLAISALGGLCLAAAGWIAASGHKAGFGWVLGFEILNSAGFANVFPVGLALYARVAPKSVSGTFVAIYYLHLFLCNSLVGWLGGLVDKMSGVHFWLLHAGLVAASAFIMFLAARFFGRWLTPDKPDGVGAGAAATA